MLAPTQTLSNTAAATVLAGSGKVSVRARYRVDSKEITLLTYDDKVAAIASAYGTINRSSTGNVLSVYVVVNGVGCVFRGLDPVAIVDAAYQFLKEWELI